MSEDNIFREVDEELRSDRMRSFWRRYAVWIIGAAVAVVALVAVNEGWRWYQSTNSAKSSDELYAAFAAADGGDIDKARTTLQGLINNGTGGYPTLARFRDAGLLAKSGKTADAIAAYDALANTGTNQRLRELALVLAGTLLVDTGSVADVQSRVESLTAEGSPMRNAAREAMGLAQYKAKDYKAAQANFEAVVNDAGADNAMRNRINYYLAQMLADGNIAPKAPAAQAADAVDQAVGGAAPAAARVVDPAAIEPGAQ